MNTAYSTRFGAPEIPVGGPFRLVFTRGARFLQDEPSNAFSHLSGNVIATFIPAAEWEGTAVYRAFTFYQDQVKNLTAVDTWPDIEQDSQRVPDTLPLIELPSP